jgi:hypothetical protein
MADQPAEQIIFRACAGLGNRLRALVSAMCLAEDLQRPLNAIWDRDSHCGALFNDLFDETSLPPFVRVSDGPRLSQSVEVRVAEHVRDYFYLSLRTPIVIHSHQAFYGSGTERWAELLRALKPDMFVQALYDTRMLEIPPGPRVGVHIRRTDHQKAIMNSPTGAFVTAMKSCSDDTVFILATDSDKEAERLREEFPGRVFMLALINDRGSVMGMKNAVLDFMGLASSQKIFGSYFSSFGVVAAAYGTVPLEIIVGP